MVIVKIKKKGRVKQKLCKLLKIVKSHYTFLSYLIFTIVIGEFKTKGRVMLKILCKPPQNVFSTTISIEALGLLF